MFNGIILNIGKVKTIKNNKNNKLVGIETNLKLKKRDIGSSISCNGVCLTLVKISNKKIFFYLSNETIKRSNFKKIKLGQIINLEKSMIYGQKISGHFIQGHVDTTALVKKVIIIDKSWSIKLEMRNRNLNKYLEEKAYFNKWSFIDDFKGFKITFFKYNSTYSKINKFKKLKKDDLVNVELDIFGKYI